MSDTVKVIIEIPKDEYKDIKDHEQMIRNYPTTSLIRILNGIPLDDVKAEIDQLPLVLYAGYDHIEKDSVMQILDDIGKESEVKPNE